MIERNTKEGDTFVCQLYNGPQCVSLGKSKESENDARQNAYGYYNYQVGTCGLGDKASFFLGNFHAGLIRDEEQDEE